MAERVPVAQRLWSRVAVVGECWEFSGARNGQGYGMIRFEGRTELAHRVAYRLTRGDIPPGLCILHKCDNPPCLNPDHLQIGTVADNNRDRVAKGRDFWLAKTHCPAGHPYDEANTLVRKCGARKCRECGLEVARRHREANRDVLNARARAARAAKKGAVTT